MLLRKINLLLSVVLLSSCLPDEGDVSARYNAINQRAHIENVAESLATSAQNLSAYLSASQMKRKTPLQEEGKVLSDDPTDFTVQNNPTPIAPTGVQVNACGQFGAIAYFTQVPMGVADLKKHGNSMAASLVRRFGHEQVGIKMYNGVQLPKKAIELGCGVGDDIIEGSPIFVAGFLAPKDSAGNDLGGLPDPSKTQQPTFKRDVTLPCPTGMDGVIKREQICQLKFSDNSTQQETTTVIIGTATNKVQRLHKYWECTPDNNVPLEPPTPVEISAFCRNPADDIQKQADNAIEMTVDSLKQELDTGTPGYYTFYCRTNKDGSDTCDATPYTAPPKTFLRCDTTNPVEQYVVNPTLPLKLDATGKIISATPTAVAHYTPPGSAPVGNNDCGKGWKGDLIAGYKVRQCELVKIVDGTETILSKAQTIYKIAYVAAKCTNANSKEASYQCPHPYKGQVQLREAFSMKRPIALQLGPEPEPGKWTSSTIAWKNGFFGGNANIETLTRALSQGYRVANEELNSLINPEFSSELESVMNIGEYIREINGCKLANQTCVFPPDPIRVGFVFDRSGSMTLPTPAESNINKMTCQIKLEDIFSDKIAACAIIDRHNLQMNHQETGGEYQVEGQLQAYLVSNDAKYYTLLHNALENRTSCNQTISDEIGYCPDPNGPAKQPTCAPGTCIKISEKAGGTRLNVALAQLGVGISRIPSGSDFKYTEYIGNTINVVTRQFCSEKDDPTCEHAQNLKALSNALTGSRSADGDTPLMEASVEALKQFTHSGNSTMPQILFFFTDGKATDGQLINASRKDYAYPFAGFCEEERRNDREICDAVGISGRSLSEDEALTVFRQAYTANNCSSSTPSSICYGITLYYNGVSDKLHGAAWKDCENFVTQPYPTTIDYIKQNYPDLKVYIVNLGSPDLESCDRKQGGNVQYLDVQDADAFDRAFTDAFKKSGALADPLDVCQKMRALYPKAINY
ncbi:hypothetical protein [Emticicia soli]|uniref:hypothetical protein n=1 Tax=Emticicia soli TaxID=2027878 RepID=UPI0030EF0FB5